MSGIKRGRIDEILKRRGLADEIAIEQQRQQAVATSVAGIIIEDQQQQSAVVHNNNCSNWNFRPSALQYNDYGKGTMSVTEIVDVQEYKLAMIAPFVTRSPIELLPLLVHGFSLNYGAGRYY